ncbi:MAG: helix-turn-helix transcriptional regulator [Candidatus Thorarchaeota archaeon]
MHVTIKKISGTPQEVEKVFGLDAGTLANWRMEGKGPKYRKIGPRKTIYIFSEVKEWLDYHMIRTSDSVEIDNFKKGCQ